MSSGYNLKDGVRTCKDCGSRDIGIEWSVYFATGVRVHCQHCDQPLAEEHWVLPLRKTTKEEP